MSYWTLPPGKDREEAKRQYEQSHPVDNCFIGRNGLPFEYVTDREREVARRLSQTNLIADPNIAIKEREGKVYFVGSRITIEALVRYHLVVKSDV